MLDEKGRLDRKCQLVIYYRLKKGSCMSPESMSIVQAGWQIDPLFGDQMMLFLLAKAFALPCGVFSLVLLSHNRKGSRLHTQLNPTEEGSRAW